MFGLTRWTIVVCAMIVSGILAGISVGVAQSPRSPSSPQVPPPPGPPDPPDRPLPPGVTGELTLPKLERLDIAPADDSPDPKSIRGLSDAILSGERNARTGNPTFDGAAEILQTTGSILDDSSLDPRLADPGRRPTLSGSAKRAHTAELLLRTSRQLEQFAEDDHARRELVRQMRHEAGRLLTQAGIE